MLTLTLWLLLQWNRTGPKSGVELRADDPQGKNAEVMVACANLSNGAGCRVRFTPGTYTMKRSINLPNGVVEADFSGVMLIPCARMNALITMAPLGVWHSAKIIGLNYNASQACGSFVPPLEKPVDIH